MPEASSPHPLADRALSRLRKLADGNGLAPAQIELVEAREQIYKLDGVMRLVPYCEKRDKPPVGGARNTKRQTVATFAALQTAAQAHQKQFLESATWIETARKELRQAPGEGWGLDGATVTLPDQSVTLAASETCPACRGSRMMTCVQCQGQGFVTCIQCQGRGQELCWNCGGRGINPASPNQPCIVCHGTRYTHCRFCRSTGKLTCPTCQGQRGTACTQCRGLGQIVKEITLFCGVTTQFVVKGEALPSGLKRGLSRLGYPALANGHADVRLLDAQKRDKDDAAAPKPEIHYEARMPYADLRMRFGPDARVVLISVFGKRGVMLGVPPFLDEALKPARKALADAARGGGPLDDALKARALHDALALELGGKRQAADLRRLYPVGLTADTAGEIMREMRLALGRFTRRERAIAAAGGGLIGAGLLAGWFLTPLHARALPGLPWQAALAVDLCAFILILGLARIGLGASAQFALQRRFPNLRISLRRSVGVIGYAMLGFIAAAGAASIWFAPLRPLWLDYLLRLIAQR